MAFYILLRDHYAVRPSSDHIEVRRGFAFVSRGLLITYMLRIYALTMNNRWIASYLSFMTLAQFAFGMYLSIFLALRPGMSSPVFEECI